MKKNNRSSLPILGVSFATLWVLLSALILFLAPVAFADVVFLDDVDVEGSLCSSDSDNCADGEIFSSGSYFAEIKVKDNFPSIWFDDNNTGQADWWMGIDSSGGQPSESFWVYNNETGTTPFLIENGTANHLLYLDAAERIGINTNVPAYTVDAIGNRIRLRNSTSASARTLMMRADGTSVDLQSENVDLYIRSVGNDIIMNPYGSDYNVGIGTTAPSKKLHVRGSDSASLSYSNVLARIENVTGTTGSRHMLQLVNRGNPLLWFHNTQNDIRWSMNPIDTSFVFSRGGSGGYEMQLYSNGNLVIRGTLTQNSDRNTKKNIEAVNPVNVLDKVAALPISTWQFKNDTEKSRHLGPMAQDFYAAFGLGRDEKGIAPVDVSGVALAAIKGLNTVVKDKDAKIVQLEGKVADLEEKLQAQQEQLARLSALAPVVAKLVHQLNAQGTMNVSFETTPAGNHSF